MSNSIFPIPPGNISGGSRGWPIGKYAECASLLETPAAFRGETGISLTPYCIWQFQMTFPKLNSTSNAQSFNDQTGYLAKVAGFFMQMKGRAYTWLYDDTTDNTIAAGAPATFALGDAATKAFQLARPIGGYLDIIQNLNGAASIYVAGVLKTTGTDYSIDSLGVVTFVAAPALNAVIAWSGKYYFRCRFTKDACDQLKMVFTNYWTLQQLDWKSVIV